MQMINDITLTSFSLEHITAAVALSRQARWPHRPEDWRMLLQLSIGTVAVGDDGRVVGTALMTPYGRDCATINTVIVDEALRGRGLGRRLMAEALTLAEGRPLRLISTDVGVSLYRNLGFVDCGENRQHQGAVATVAAPANVRHATKDDIATVKALDRAAFGADRGSLVDALVAHGQLAVLRQDRGVRGFAAIRPFGRGEVIGPVVAATANDAQALIAFFAAPRAGAFLRVDTPGGSGMSPWLADIGLAEVDCAIAMRKPAKVGERTTHPIIFALASQGLG
jgi:predicted N-acetyltransferase YhbS